MTTTMQAPVTILLVEDNDDDVILTRDALHSSNLSVSLDVLSNGEDTMAYLNQLAPFDQVKTPNVVLLDLNLPRRNGWEVLKAMKTDARLKIIPVIILTTSDQDPDIQRAYELGANGYVTKPLDLEQFRKVVNDIEDFWFTVVKIPSSIST